MGSWSGYRKFIYDLRRFSESRSSSRSTQSVRPSVRTQEWTLVGDFKIPKFLINGINLICILRELIYSK